MSEFTVCRTLDTYPALRYCLLLDDDRIAGGKPDYRGDNFLISWRTKETYGPVDALMNENAKLREQVEQLHADQAHWELGNCPSCPNIDDLQEALEQNAKLRELVDGYIFCDATVSSSSDECIGCPLLDQSPHGYRCTKADRMRELGVEVSE